LSGFALMFSLSVFAQKTYIHAGRLIDVKTKKVLTEQTIVVEADKILSVSSGYQNGADEDKTIDLKNATVMPGLMDMHVHIESQPAPRATSTDFATTKPTSPTRRSRTPILR